MRARCVRDAKRARAPRRKARLRAARTWTNMDDFNPENKVLHMYNSKIRDGRRKLNCQFQDKQITPGPPYFNVARAGQNLLRTPKRAGLNHVLENLEVCRDTCAYSTLKSGVQGVIIMLRDGNLISLYGPTRGPVCVQRHNATHAPKTATIHRVAMQMRCA